MNSAELGLVAIASLLTWGSSFAVPFKKNGILVRLSFLPATFLLELCVILIQRAGVTGKFVATAFELITHFMLFCLYGKGIIWKNYIVWYVTTQSVNIVIAVLTVIVPAWGTIYTVMILREGYMDPVQYILLMVVNISVSFLFALLVRKIMKPEILSGANVYRVMTFILITAVVLMNPLGRGITDWNRAAYDGGVIFILGFWIIFTIIWLLIFNVIAYVYNRAEKRRIRSRRALIEKLADDNYSHYRDLARTNDELKVLYGRTSRFRNTYDREKIYADYVSNMGTAARDRYEFSLSGCLAVDSLMYEYSKKAKSAGISFSAVLEPFDRLPISMQDAAAIVEYLMEGVFARVTGGHRSDAWIMLDWRMRRGMMIIVLAYHGAEKKRFSKRNIEFVRDIVSMHYGVVQTIREDEEDQIRLFIPSQNDNSKETEDTGLAAV